jgi:uncharacterized protein (UPF0332 family)
MRSEGAHLPVSSAHQDLWKYFEGKDMYRRNIAANGQRLRRRRNQADYEADVKISTNEVTESIRNAESIINLVGKLT